MSTVVVVRKGKEVCIAADTLTTYGAQLDSADSVANSNKIIKVGSSYIGAVGPASAQLILESYFSKLKKKPSFKNVHQIFETFRKMHAVLKKDYYLNPIVERDEEFETMHLQCLIANQYGIFGVYHQRTVCEYEKFYAFGSGDEYAQGAMYAVYKTKKSAEDIAKVGIETSAKLSANTGLPMTWYTIKLKK